MGVFLPPRKKYKLYSELINNLEHVRNEQWGGITIWVNSENDKFVIF